MNNLNIYYLSTNAVSLSTSWPLGSPSSSRRNGVARNYSPNSLHYTSFTHLLPPFFSPRHLIHRVTHSRQVSHLCLAIYCNTKWLAFYAALLVDGRSSSDHLLDVRCSSPIEGDLESKPKLVHLTSRSWLMLCRSCWFYITEEDRDDIRVINCVLFNIGISESNSFPILSCLLPP